MLGRVRAGKKQQQETKRFLESGISKQIKFHRERQSSTLRSINYVHGNDLV